MGTERDDSVDRVLKALGRADAPEGLEGRITEGLEREALATRGAEFGWLDVVRGSAMSGIWWRGAMSGAAAVMLAVGVTMVVGYFVRQPTHIAPEVRGTAVRSAEPVGAAVVGLAQREDRRAPCASASAPRMLAASMERQGDRRVQIVGWAQPPFGSPLTAQERSLVRVLQSADPKELAMLNPEMRAQRDAEDAAQFQSFFTHPVYKPTDSASAEPTSTQLSNEPALGGNQ